MSESAQSTALGALKAPGFRPFLVTFGLTMMADNIEHVISYWLLFQKFHSAELGGFAVVAHWLPYLLFSVRIGALNDRFDSRRLIQIGGGLFLVVSLGWGYFFATDTLQIWHAMLLLVLHGSAGVFWSTSSQVLLYDIVGPAQLEAAVRLNATVRYLGVLVGPGIGSLLMLTLGPVYGIFVNALFYVPLLFWLARAPYGRGRAVNSKAELPALELRPFPSRPGQALNVVQTIQQVRSIPAIWAMLVLSGAASFFVGNSYQAQMPGFAAGLGHPDPGFAYTSLLAADACGALLSGFLLASRKNLLPMRSKTALRLAFGWGLSLLGFACVRQYWLAVPLLFLAGFFELAFSSMAQALVQVNAPLHIRGRVLGVFGMASSGLRTFSGLTVGWLGSVVSIHTSLACACFAFLVLGLVVRAAERA